MKSRAILALVLLHTSVADAETESVDACPEPPKVITIRGASGGTICVPIRFKTLTTIHVPETATVKLYDHPAVAHTPEPELHRLSITALDGAEVGTHIDYKILDPGFTATLRLQVVDRDVGESDFTIEHESSEQAQLRKLRRQMAAQADTAQDRASKDRTRIEELQDEVARAKRREQAANAKNQTRIEELQSDVAREKRHKRAAKVREIKAAARADAAEEKAQQLETQLKDSQELVKATERKAKQQVQEAVKTTKADAERENLERTARRERLLRDGAKVSRLSPIYGIELRTKSSEKPLKLDDAFWDDTGRWLLVDFEWPGSTDPRPLELAQLSVEPKDGPAYEALLLNSTSPSTKPGLIATVYPGETLKGTIAIKTGPRKDLKETRHRIELRDATGERAIGVTVLGWKSQLVKLVVEPETARDAWARGIRESEQYIIFPRLVGGLFWVPNGLEEGAGRQFAITSFGGAGIRVVRGISYLLAVEADIVGGFTRNASFDQGSRSGYFGRLTTGAILRLGIDRIPVMRFGFGFLGARYDSDTLTNSKWEFSGLLSFGLGYNRRLSEHWLIGASFTTITAGSENIRALELGIQIGYGISPEYPK